jgi:predicted RNase H-like HicB family nuclease
MPRQFTLEYWQDGGWYVGRLTEVPGVFSQGETLENLADNIRDAYRMMMEADRDTRTDVRRTEITVDV